MELLDRRQDGRAARADEVARIHLARAQPALERRPDLRVAEIDLRQLELRLRLVALADPVLHGRLGGGVLLHHGLLSVELELRSREGGLVELDLSLVRRLFDHEQQLAFRHDGSIFEVHGLEIAGHARDEVHRLRRGDRSRQLQVLDDRLRAGRLHRDGGRRGGGRRRFPAAGRGRAGGERSGERQGDAARNAFPVHGSSSGEFFGMCRAVSSSLPQLVRRAISALTSSEMTSPPSRISQPPPSAR